jgi:hypothetical protein
MKRTLIAVAIALIAVGAASAQPWAGQPGTTQPNLRQNSFGPGYAYSSQFPAVTFEKITLEGTLSLVNSFPAIQKDGKTYYVMVPNRLYGFVDGLKEGANVKIDGYSHEIVGTKDTYTVQVSDITINGKTIDLSNVYGTMGNGRGMMGGSYAPGSQYRGMMGGSYGPGSNYRGMPMGRW